MNEMGNAYHRRVEDDLGPNSEIGRKLRALYGAVQQEEIPSRLLDLLEQLDAAENKTRRTAKGE